MGLFSKKKEEAKPELPPLKFPRFPKESKVPSYEPEVSSAEAESIKQAVSQKPTDPAGLDIPIRKPMGRRPIIPPPAEAPKELRQEGVQKRGQTLFVKIERYKEAVVKMDHIKEVIGEAEQILKKLDEIKRQEDEELIKWHQDLETIKTKILSVDKNLFGD
ncbi:MAG: hypothetical protein ISS23_02820 [Nanoarchaeota archaeon]|nr:hypothetical protein [Nanoarchaeota archaeon]